MCWEAGWVCAPHGSMIHDLDLLLTPWHDGADSTQDVLNRIQDVLLKIEPFAHIVYVMDRPFHRKCYCAQVYGQACLDISVIDIREPWDESSVVPEEDGVEPIKR